MEENFKLHDVTRILLGRLITRTERNLSCPILGHRIQDTQTSNAGKKGQMCLLILGQTLIIGPAQRATSVHECQADDLGHERRTWCKDTRA